MMIVRYRDILVETPRVVIKVILSRRRGSRINGTYKYRLSSRADSRPLGRDSRDARKERREGCPTGESRSRRVRVSSPPSPRSLARSLVRARRDSPLVSNLSLPLKYSLVVVAVGTRRLWSNITVSMGARRVHCDLRRSRSYDATCPHSHSHTFCVPARKPVERSRASSSRAISSPRARSRAGISTGTGTLPPLGVLQQYPLLNQNLAGQLMHICVVKELY